MNYNCREYFFKPDRNTYTKMSLRHTNLNDLDYLICNIIIQQVAYFDVAIKDILRVSKQTAIKCKNQMFRMSSTIFIIPVHLSSKS